MDKDCLPEKDNKLSLRSLIIRLGLLSIVVVGTIITCSFFGVIVVSFLG